MSAFSDILVFIFESTRWSQQFQNRILNYLEKMPPRKGGI